MKETVQISPQTFIDSIDNFEDPMVAVSFRFDRVGNGGRRVIGRNLLVDYGQFQLPLSVMFFPEEEVVGIVQLQFSGPNFLLTEEMLKGLNIWCAHTSPQTEFQVYQYPDDYLALVLEKKTSGRTPDDLQDWIREFKSIAPKFAQRLDQDLNI